MAIFKPYIKKHIYQQFPFVAPKLMTMIDEEYALVKRNVDFAHHSVNPLDKRLDLAAYILSVIIILDEQGIAYDQIKSIILNVANEYVKPKNALHAWWKKAKVNLLSQPYMHWFLDKFDTKVSRKGHPDGFVAHIIQKRKSDNEFVFGFDILECGICKLFNRYNYGHYVHILCEVDFITSELAGLTLHRSGTIASGAHKCDFRFEKK